MVDFVAFRGDKVGRSISITRRAVQQRLGDFGCRVGAWATAGALRVPAPATVLAALSSRSAALAAVAACAAGRRYRRLLRPALPSRRPGRPGSQRRPASAAAAYRAGAAARGRRGAAARPRRDLPRLRPGAGSPARGRGTRSWPARVYADRGPRARSGAAAGGRSDAAGPGDAEPGHRAEATPARIRVNLRRAPDGLAPGDRVRLRARLQPPLPPALPGGVRFRAPGLVRAAGGDRLRDRRGRALAGGARRFGAGASPRCAR